METCRVITFEEEASFYEKEARAEFAKETGDGDCSVVNGILRRGMRVIAKARREIESCLAAPEWIPVTERLPEHDFKVLVYGGEELLYVNGILQPTPCVYTGYLYDIDPEPCFFTWDKPQNVIKNVTHWMPIPRPPKGE